MPTYQTHGIVIGRTNFGEADRVIRFITPDHGKLSAVARGVRKIKSRSGGHLELFGEVGLMLATGRNLDVVTSARLAWYPHNIADNYQRLGLAYAFTGMIDKLAQERHAQPELHEHLYEALQAVDGGASGVLIELWYKLRLLHLTGLRPELTHCVSCGQANPEAGYAFDAERGGIVCGTCAIATARPMAVNIIKLWRIASDYPYATVGQIGGGEELAAASLPLCDEFYEYHIGRSFRPEIA